VEQAYIWQLMSSYCLALFIAQLGWVVGCCGELLLLLHRRSSGCLSCLWASAQHATCVSTGCCWFWARTAGEACETPCWQISLRQPHLTSPHLISYHRTSRPAGLPAVSAAEPCRCVPGGGAGQGGGRVHSYSGPFAAPVDLGASLITGTAADVREGLAPDPVTFICKQLNITLHRLTPTPCPSTPARASGWHLMLMKLSTGERPG